MRALVYSSIGEVRMEKAPTPIPGPGQVLLKVVKTGICGSDTSGFLGHSARRQPPLILGHEVVGVVAACPAGEWPFEVGDRVVANPLQSCGKCAHCRSGRPNICSSWNLLGMDRIPGAFAEYVSVDARNVFLLRPDMPDDQAVMIEPLSNAIHLFGLIGRHHFGSLAIFGAGTQGALMLSVARLLGYRDIAVVDPNPDRLEVARQLGASKLLDPRDLDPVAALQEWTDGGVDTGIDAAGVTTTRQALIQSVRKGGEILLLGLHDNFSDLEINLVVRKEQRLQGSFAYTPADFGIAKRVLERNEVNLQPWTHTRPLEEGQAAFDLLVSNPGAVLKIALQP